MSDPSQKPIAEEKWWDSDTLAVVTGANKGIGFESARILGREGLHVVATARDQERGTAAVAKLKELEPSATFTFQQLDTTDAASVAACADAVKSKLGKVDILLNNAGMAYKGDAFGADEAQETIDTNLKGTRAVTEAILPLMQQGGTIVNVCSGAGKLKQLNSEELKEAFRSPDSADKIVELTDNFVKGIREGNHADKGWPNRMYGVSKLAEISYTFWLSRQLADKGIRVNAVCPGWCQTDMSSQSGPKTAAQGADTPVWTALLPPKKGITGHFFQEREEFGWEQ